MPLPFGLSWADILGNDDCCCSEPIPDTCADCDEDLVDLCYRVRRAYPSSTNREWPEEAESLWLQVANVNARCGEAFVTDQLGCKTDALEAWSFDDTEVGEIGGSAWPYPEHNYFGSLEAVGDGGSRVTPIEWPYKLTWNTGPSCNTVEIDMIGGTGTLAGSSDYEYSDHSLESLGSIFSSAEWPDVFRIGEWEFTKSTNCITPVAGPECFRVIGGADERDVSCATFNPTGEPRRLNALGAFGDTQGSCFAGGGNDSFGGHLVDTTSSTTAVVWWRINTARTYVQVHVAASVVDPMAPTVLGRLDDAYVWLPYTPDWWVGGVTVGDYTVTACADCESYTCFPDCLVLDCGDGAQHNALFMDVTSLNGCCVDGSYELDWYDTPGHYYKKIGDPTLTTCGYIEVWYECNSTTFRRRVKITDANGGTSESTEDNAGACVGGEFSDSFDVPSSFLTPLCFNNPPFYTDTVTIDVYT